MSVVTKINTVARHALLGSLLHRSVINGRDTLEFDVRSPGAAYRPSGGDDVLLEINATAKFGGIIQRIAEVGSNNEPSQANAVNIDSHVVCSEYGIYTDRRFIDETFAAGTTVKQFLQAIEPYLTPFGASLDPAQANGPAFSTEMQFHGDQLTSAIAQVTTLTDYVFRMSPTKVFGMYQVGVTAAPIDLIDGTTKHTGDIRINRTQGVPINRYIARVGGSGFIEITDSFTGNGVLDTFPVSLPVSGPTPPSSAGSVAYGVVDIPTGVGTESVGGLTSPMIWLYDPVASTIERQLGAVTNGVNFEFRYQTQGPFIVIVEDAASVAADGPNEMVVSFPNTTSVQQIQAILTAMLAKSVVQRTELQFMTREVGLDVGQVLTAQIATRNINDDFIISEITARGQKDEQDLVYTVTAVDIAAFFSFRDVYKFWGLGNSASGTSGPTIAPHGGVPGSPVRSIQFNRNGGFGGDDEVLLDEDGSGSTAYGVEGLPAKVAIGSADESWVQLALFNTTGGLAEALTIWLTNGGSCFIEHDSGLSTRDLSITEYNGGLNLSGNTGMVLDPSRRPDQTDRWGRGTGLWIFEAFGLGSTRSTSTTPALDAGVGAGGGPDGVFLWAASADGTLSIPALTALNNTPGTSMHRIFIIKNITSTRILTIDPNSTDQIFDGSATANTLLLYPGEAVMIQARTGTGAGWYVLASHRAFSPETALMGTGAVAGRTIGIGRNSSGNGAAGTLRLVGRDGTDYFLWVDDNGVLRIHTAAPTEDNSTVADNAGTVVGTQT